MKINFNVNLKDMKGVESDQNLGELLAMLLSQSSEGNANKLIPWGFKLMGGQELDLDVADQKLLTEFIGNVKDLTNLGKYRLTEVIETTQAIHSKKAK
mgnify:CR=1 FL=1|tara:strand:- start:13770 stop:14063 length:294 start_codon:yes stop_codon:yes gene_type:complete